MGCPQCGTTVANLLGVLGNKVWVRCRACGWDYRVKEDTDAQSVVYEVDDRDRFVADAEDRVGQ